MSAMDNLKQKVWSFLYKYFSTIQRALLKIGIIWHEEKRQKYHIGWLAPGKTLEELKLHLHSKWGFGNHFVAWVDPGQVLSWRKLESFNRQYHVRVFEDGEIRGHYEYTPEAHPVDHFIEVGEENRKKEFMKFLGDFVVRERYISQLEMDPNAYDPESQITIEKMQGKTI